ncbi:MAG TPA: cytochrome c [Flavipsychrobacter sp.]|nr:cytochrome c [Flavipsychrobacter sp.]
MKRYFFLILFVCASGAAIVNTYASPQSAKGKDLYERKCSRCHGDDGALQKKGATDLKADSDLSDAALIRIITAGKKKMPAFGEKLSAAEIQAVAAYTKSLRK